MTYMAKAAVARCSIVQRQDFADAASMYATRRRHVLTILQYQLSGDRLVNPKHTYVHHKICARAIHVTTGIQAPLAPKMAWKVLWTLAPARLLASKLGVTVPEFLLIFLYICHTHSELGLAANEHSTHDDSPKDHGRPKTVQHITYPTTLSKRKSTSSHIFHLRLRLVHHRRPRQTCPLAHGAPRLTGVLRRLGDARSGVSQEAEGSNKETKDLSWTCKLWAASCYEENSKMSCVL